eukprot:m.473223 g.473223  ORF g.473223 m.473223 type:complete len:296 (+) comp57119_c0_seq15:812-1699(+)
MVRESHLFQRGDGDVFFGTGLDHIAQITVLDELNHAQPRSLLDRHSQHADQIDVLKGHHRIRFTQELRLVFSGRATTQHLDGDKTLRFIFWRVVSKIHFSELSCTDRLERLELPSVDLPLEQGALDGFARFPWNGFEWISAHASLLIRDFESFAHCRANIVRLATSMEKVTGHTPQTLILCNEREETVRRASHSGKRDVLHEDGSNNFLRIERTEEPIVAETKSKGKETEPRSHRVQLASPTLLKPSKILIPSEEIMITTPDSGYFSSKTSLRASSTISTPFIPKQGTAPMNFAS